MPEFMALVDVKQQAVKAASGEPEMFTPEDAEAMVESLRDRGIIDDGGLVRG